LRKHDLHTVNMESGPVHPSLHLDQGETLAN
jgi:hypothetical protein